MHGIEFRLKQRVLDRQVKMADSLKIITYNFKLLASSSQLFAHGIEFWLRQRVLDR